MTAVITGGAGFVGANLAHRLLERGERVRVFDDLSRAGVERNVAWLRELHGPRLELDVADVRDPAALRRALRDADFVFHLAAQVAVTTSLGDPAADFEVNARGTLNVLEAARRSPSAPGVLFTSTNKVYGGLGDVPLRARGGRYEPEDEALRGAGVSERRPLEFSSPYGCSKGAADQYVLDYARTFGLRAVVFRMSCIYGPRQFGNEDQGWVAHFALRALRGEPITLYGDGRQVRDLLFVDDLVDAMLLARGASAGLAGRAFNLGGGPANTLSLVELLEELARVTGRHPATRFETWRPADQRWYVSDAGAFTGATGWRARTGTREGVRRLAEWLKTLAPQAPSLAAGEALR